MEANSSCPFLRNLCGSGDVKIPVGRVEERGGDRLAGSGGNGKHDQPALRVQELHNRSVPT